MALPMDEQRILAEIERQLAADDPSLAARLTTFGRPGLAVSLRTPRGRVLASFLTVAVVAVLSLMVYSMVPFRALPILGTHGRSTASPSQAAKTAPASQPGPASSAGAAAARGSTAGGAPAGRRAGQAAAGAGGGRNSRTARAARPAGQRAASPQQAGSG